MIRIASTTGPDPGLFNHSIVARGLRSRGHCCQGRGGQLITTSQSPSRSIRPTRNALKGHSSCAVPCAILGKNWLAA
jgi:hypothetical protein